MMYIRQGIVITEMLGTIHMTQDMFRRRDI